MSFDNLKIYIQHTNVSYEVIRLKQQEGQCHNMLKLATWDKSTWEGISYTFDF